MLTDDDQATRAEIRDVARELIGHYALSQESLHASWRCGYPDIYGPCGCVDEFIESVEEMVAPIVTARVSAALREAADECDVLQMREKIAPGGIGDGDFKHGKKRAFGEARIMLRQRAIDYWRTGLGTDT